MHWNVIVRSLAKDSIVTFGGGGVKSWRKKLNKEGHRMEP